MRIFDCSLFNKHDRVALSAMRPGEAALYVPQVHGGYFIPVRVDDDSDIDSAAWHLEQFEASGVSCRCLYVECTAAGGEGTVLQVTASQGRELLLERWRRLAGLRTAVYAKIAADAEDREGSELEDAFGLPPLDAVIANA